ncbi:MAG: permease-like cell division protein FtsX, partial [Muribaculaceae bacterium]|nr:permease-like cell division protein FtsX [Muribaculaceae bacterium]
MKDKRLAKISTFGSQITSVISVALVLLILGILAMALQASRSLSDDIRSNIGFVVKLAPSASDADINRVKSLVGATPGVASFVFASPESILAEESRLMGEDYAGLLDENPFGAEFEIKMKPEYASGDSIATVSARIAADAAVAETVSESAVIDSVNSVLRRLSVVLLAIAAALLVISFVLINNTV